MQNNPRVHDAQIFNKLVPLGTRTEIQTKEVHLNENKHETLP